MDFTDTEWRFGCIFVGEIHELTQITVDFISDRAMELSLFLQSILFSFLRLC